MLGGVKIVNSKRVILSMAIAVLMVASVFASGCIGGDDDDTEEKGTVSFGLPPWPGVTVKTEVVRIILEEKGYTVESSKLDAGVVYAEMADGNIDCLLAGWLPITHQEYWNQYGDQLEQVAINCPTTWLGLAVPTYVYDEGVTSIEDLNDYKDEFDSRIVGIEPGAGIMNSTEQVIETYDLDYDLESSSTPAMMAEVDAYIDDNDWIVFTIWEPHSAFARFDIQKLEDPEGIYGGGDVLYTITRNDFADDFPEVYEFFQNFQISADTQSAWILEYSDNERPPEEVAQEWVDNNQELVDEWWPS